jgi:hypothetical protein
MGLKFHLMFLTVTELTSPIPNVMNVEGIHGIVSTPKLLPERMNKRRYAAREPSILLVAIMTATMHRLPNNQP